MDKIDANYMEYISSLRELVLSVTTESLEDDAAFKKALLELEKKINLL
jgi:hypothetical protein